MSQGWRGKRTDKMLRNCDESIIFKSMLARVVIGITGNIDAVRRDIQKNLLICNRFCGMIQLC